MRGQRGSWHPPASPGLTAGPARGLRALLCPGLPCFHHADAWGQVRRAPEEPEWQQELHRETSSWLRARSALLRLPARGPSALSASAGGEALPLPLPGQALAGILVCVEGPLGARRAALSGPGLPGPAPLPGTELLREDQAEAPQPLAAPGPRQTPGRGASRPPAREDSHCLCVPGAPGVNGAEGWGAWASGVLPLGFSLAAPSWPPRVSCVSQSIRFSCYCCLIIKKDSAFGNHGHFFPLHQVSELKTASKWSRVVFLSPAVRMPSIYK